MSIEVLKPEQINQATLFAPKDAIASKKVTDTGFDFESQSPELPTFISPYELARSIVAKRKKEKIKKRKNGKNNGTNGQPTTHRGDPRRNQNPKI